MNCIYALCVASAAVTLGACQPRQDLHQIVTKPVLDRQATKPVYLAETRLRLTVPVNVTAEEQTPGDSMPSYSFKRAEQSLVVLHLENTAEAFRALAQRQGAKNISAGSWQGFLQETNDHGKLTGELLIRLRKDWLSRLYDSFTKQVWDLRARIGIPLKRTEQDMEKHFQELQVKDFNFQFLYFFYSNLSETDRDLVLEIVASLDMESLRTVFTSTVDWYKPPPDKFLNFRQDRLEIPHELVVGVPMALHDEATALLGDADFVALTDEQTKHFSAATNPDAILQSLIKQRMEKLRFFLDHPVSGFRGRELDRQKATHQSIIDQLNSDIEQFRQWDHQLKPYLIKAVTLQGDKGFGGRFISEDDLLIYEVALGRHPLPMRRMPVVAFLPRKPHKIYTAVGMIE